MPISRYNQDGTVDIFNSKTGEVRRGVKPETLGEISPNLVAEYQTGLAAQDEKSKATELVKSGGLRIEDLPQDLRIDIASELGSVPPKLTGQAASDSALYEGVINALKNIQGRGDVSSYTGPLDTLKNTFKIQTNQQGAEDVAAFRQDVGDVRTAIRNLISGANVSPAEAKEFENLIPKTVQSDTQFKAIVDALSKKSKGKIEAALRSQGYNMSADQYLGTGKKVSKEDDPLGIL